MGKHVISSAIVVTGAMHGAELSCPTFATTELVTFSSIAFKIHNERSCLERRCLNNPTATVRFELLRVNLLLYWVKFLSQWVILSSCWVSLSLRWANEYANKCDLQNFVY
jgi:hypothetical protein